MSFRPFLSSLPAAGLFLALYPWLRYGAGGVLFDTVGLFGIYTIETLYAGVGLWLLGSSEPAPSGGPRLAWQGAVSLVVATGVTGVLVALVSDLRGIQVPFQVEDSMTRIQLLAVAPVLEELLFRGLSSRAFEKLGASPRLAAVAVTVMFSLAHLEAYGRVDPAGQAFVIYQTLYVILLSAACGFLRIRSGRVTLPVVAHFLFNLGFYWGVSVLVPLSR